MLTRFGRWFNSGGSGNPSKLAAPQNVAGLDVRLDLHVATPYSWISFANSVRVVSLQFLDGLEIPSDLAAPQCVASFGVRLDLHVIAPYLGFFLLGRAVALQFWTVRKPVNLAAPQCVAGLGVRLYLHGSAPFLGDLLDSFQLCCQAP